MSVRYPYMFALPRFGSRGESDGTKGNTELVHSFDTESFARCGSSVHAYGRSMSPMTSFV